MKGKFEKGKVGKTKMALTLYALQENMAMVAKEIREISAWLGENAANPEVDIKEINDKKAKMDELQMRFDTIKAEADKMTVQAKKTTKPVNPMEDEKTKKLKAKGEFYKAALLKGDVKSVVKAQYQQLGAIPANDADLGGGENLLPTNMSSEIITEPMETNSLREIETVTNITGLEVPILEFEIEDTDVAFITDKDTAKEIETKGNKVRFVPNKMKVKAKISDTVVHGSALNIVPVVENALRSGIALKEKLVAFNQNPASAEAHMSFYSNVNNIKKCYGTTMLKAILAAYGDLPDMFAQNAVVEMRRSDYVAMIESLANGSDTFYGKKPEDVIGIPVKFNDRAVTPIVGDFRYAHLNYDIGTIYDTDKDVDKGQYIFVITAWFDHRIKLASAFRLAIVGEDPNPSGGEPTITEVKTVAALPTDNVLNNTVYVLTAADGDKASGTMWMHNGTEWMEYTAA